MAGEVCILIPEVNGEPSDLFKGLSKKPEDRDIATYIYALYKADNIGEAMVKAGIPKNRQGEHTAESVLRYLDIDRLKNEIEADTLKFSKDLGVVDIYGNLLDLDYNTAFEKANKFNSESKGKVAFVVQNGDSFNVIIKSLTTTTLQRKIDVEEQTIKWQAAQVYLKDFGIDLNELSQKYPRVVNPINLDNFLTYLNTLEYTNGKDLTKQDLDILFTISKTNKRVQAVINKLGSGSIEAAVERVYNILQGNEEKVTPTTKSQISEAIGDAKVFNLFNPSDLINYLNRTILPEYRKTSGNYSLNKEVQRLKKEYGLDLGVYIKTSKKIETLSDAAVEAIYALERRLRTLEKMPITDQTVEESSRLNSLKEELSKEISEGKYYSGLLSVLDYANKFAIIIDEKLKTSRDDPDPAVNLRNNVALLAQIKNFMDSYGSIVHALTNINNLISDESITQDHKNNITKLALEIRGILEGFDNILTKTQENSMVKLVSSIIGESSLNGRAIADIVRTAYADSTVLDKLYAGGTVSDPVLAAMNTIIRDSQRTRDQIMTLYSQRIRRANKLLKNSDSSFMYDIIRNKDEEIINTYIVSDIDWESYEKQRAKAVANFKSRGLSDFETKQLIKMWETEHTMDREVDHLSKRTERIPDQRYRKNNWQNGWTEEQKRYYDEMMEIKGELGTMLPSYAQRQYRPPQVRKSTLDILEDGFKRRLKGSEIAQLLLDKMKIWKIREDDTNYARNGVIIGDKTYNVVNSDFDGTPLRDIPVFFINNLSDQKELVWNFSTALQHLASTAINYKIMNEIKTTVEFMRDQINDRQAALIKDKKGAVDRIKTEALILFRKVTKKSKDTRTTSLVDAFVEKYLYGIKREEDPSKFIIAIDKLIKFTSISRLALNLKGGIANTLVGEAQMLIESGARQYYGIEDYLAAHGILFGNMVTNTPGAFYDYFNQTKSTKAQLLDEMFDPEQEVFFEQASKKYHSTMFTTLFGGFNMMGLYSTGEILIHRVNMYSILNHEKVLVNGKKTSLFNAIKLDKSEDKKNPSLKIVDGATTLKGTPLKMGDKFTEEYLKEIQGKIKYCNQACHGAMNEEDKGLIHRSILGRAAANFRQWMVGHYSRRYRKRHWDDSLHKYVEGYYYTVGSLALDMCKLIKNYHHDMVAFKLEAAARWNSMDDTQKSNIRRAMSEIVLYNILCIISRFILGEPDDDNKGNYFKRMAIYQIKRMLLETSASMPLVLDWSRENKNPRLRTMVEEFFKILNSPIPSLSTLGNLFYPIFGTDDIGEVRKRNPGKGEDKYWYNIKHKTAPFISDIEQMRDFDTNDMLFNVFNN